MTVIGHAVHSLAQKCLFHAQAKLSLADQLSSDSAQCHQNLYIRNSGLHPISTGKYLETTLRLFCTDIEQGLLGRHRRQHAQARRLFEVTWYAQLGNASTEEDDGTLIERLGTKTG